MNTSMSIHSEIRVPVVASSEASVMQRSHLKEIELARRWGMSPRTLQRWRMEGVGPVYLKLGKRVMYPMNAIFDYEGRIEHISTSQRANA